MRKAGTSKAAPKGKGKKPAADDDEVDDGSGDKIVRRELKQVFTNGTIVDGAYLTTDEANYCVPIKVSWPTLDHVGCPADPIRSIKPKTGHPPSVSAPSTRLQANST